MKNRLEAIFGKNKTRNGDTATATQAVLMRILSRRPCLVQLQYNSPALTAAVDFHCLPCPVRSMPNSEYNFMCWERLTFKPTPPSNAMPIAGGFADGFHESPKSAKT